VVHAENGKEVTASIPPLEATPASTPAPGEAARAVGSSELSSAGHGSSLRPVAIVIGAVGVVSAGIGSYFGVNAISKWNQSNSDCPSGVCGTKGAQEAHDAKTSAGLADVTIGLGAAAIVTGVVLYFVGAPKNVQARADGVVIKF
jgi:hypothetical protein